MQLPFVLFELMQTALSAFTSAHVARRNWKNRAASTYISGKGSRLPARIL